jgi:hypothetical protein
MPCKQMNENILIIAEFRSNLCIFDLLKFLRIMSYLSLSFLVGCVHVLFMRDFDMAIYGPKMIANITTPIVITVTSVIIFVTT